MFKTLLITALLVGGSIFAQGTITNSPIGTTTPSSIWSVAGNTQLAAQGSDQALRYRKP
jgi:hypothetical protein